MDVTGAGTGGWTASMWIPGNSNKLNPVLLIPSVDLQKACKRSYPGSASSAKAKWIRKLKASVAEKLMQVTNYCKKETITINNTK